MAVAEKTPEVAADPAPRRRARSFRPRYPAWLTAPSLLYYAIFFLGPMAILVAFSLAVQQGFGSLKYGFDTSQYRQIASSLYITIFERTLVMASVGTAADHRGGLSGRLLDGPLPDDATRCWRCSSSWCRSGRHSSSAPTR